MNQTCKVCGEPAAGYHFGAFTCEGCKSFFGRSYNNVQSISECKNGGECTINKKNRTACKACRLRKCLLVGMSKSGSRYGRRSNWFKINFLLQEEQQKAVQAAAAAAAAAAAGASGATIDNLKTTSTPTSQSMLSFFGPSGYPAALSYARAKENMKMLGYDDYSSNNSVNNGNGKTSTTGGTTISNGDGSDANHAMPSPSISSPDSHNSDSSIEIGDRHANATNATTKQTRKSAPHTTASSNNNIIDSSPYASLPFNKELFLPLPYPNFVPAPGFLPPQSSHLLFPGYQALFAQHQGLLKPALDPTLLMQHHPSHILANNNSRFMPNHNSKNAAEELSKYYLNAVLKSQRMSTNDQQSTHTSAYDNDIDENTNRMANDDVSVDVGGVELTPQPSTMKRTTARSPTEFDAIKRMKTVSSSPSASSVHTASMSATPSRSDDDDDDEENAQDTPIDLSMKSTRSLSPNDDDDESHSRLSSSMVQCNPTVSKTTPFNREPSAGLQMIAGRT